MRRLISINIVIFVLVSACDFFDPDFGVKWQSINLTDSRVTGKWFDSRTTDEYGSGQYGESGYNYILTIKPDGTYSQIAHSYREYGEKTTYGRDFDSPISINKIEYTDSNLLGNPSIRINGNYEYIKYGID